MKQLHGNSFILGTAAFVFLAAQPVWAQISQVTDVQLNPVNGGISVALKTSSGSRPQVFTTKRGKALVADVINTQLRLPQGNSFRQDNPAPGIASVEVSQLDANSIRVTVTGSNDAPGSQPVMRSPNGITLSFSPSTGTTASAPTPTAPTPTAPPATTPAQPGQNPGVLVPNPQVTIDGQPAQTAGPGQPLSQAPPFLPRAVAPPVGDIAISATDASPSTLDLGTQERVPRLVLRDAPVREVLSLLARAAGMNLAYAGGEDKGSSVTLSQGAGDTEKQVYQTISLDIENEPVQDVFNYVLRLSGLEASRSGRTIFVAPKLPNSTRDVVIRNLRINQAKVKEILRVLVNLGAESAVNAEPKITRVTTQVAGTADGKQTNTAEDSDLTAQRIKFTDSIPLLRGLQVLGDERTSTITLIGVPRLVDIAVAQITPLDIRRRQVAVNVRIIDVNLLAANDFNTSFSFGVGNNFFTNEGGVASLNFGGSRPATTAEAANSLTNTPIINNLASTLASPYQFPKRLLASLQAQVTNGNAKILTDPTLIVQEGQTADVQLTQQVVGDITVTITDTAGGSREVRNTAKETVGLILAVQVEKIDDNGFVSLQVAPQVKSPAGTANTGNGQIILISQRSLTSGTIRLRDGQTLILSGIIQDQDRTAISKIPILGDLPLIGSLFRSTNRQNQRQEVIVLLTPQIIDDSENSSYGYNYTPSPEVRQILERRGLKVPGR
ncbi:type IV pilus secretin family protein [Nostoc sp. NMS9]|uniref:type IV pilus secretin family protein n=1 Tax=Nostoc sp. NMS9 TaxID=2815393 RepID=UPI0025E633E5|nr:type IV pilus secretin family protein [Nostoc sp. NMS9]MBN3943905.1 AMIN domain-containing protein [Nostoc sp. NMS9]